MHKFSIHFILWTGILMYQALFRSMGCHFSLVEHHVIKDFNFLK